GAALVGATVIGVSLPHPQQVQASPVVVAAAPAAALPIAAPATPAPAAEEPDPSDAASVDASSTDDLPAATVDGAAAADTATPAAADDSAATDDAAAEDGADDTAAADPDDPLGATKAGTLQQVALIVVHGDAPLRWRDAPAASPARVRAAKGTTFTGFGQVPDAPLVTSLGLLAGQGSNPAARAGCDVPTPVTPGTVDAKGVVAGTGCDYPAGTPSVPTAVAIDGRRWKAYAPVGSVDAAKAALCGAGTPDPAAQGLARENALAHLSDLASSGACEAAASPLSALAKDLTADDAPAWLVVNVGLCGTDGCDEGEAAARDRDLDAAIATLTAKDGLDASSAIFVVGDGTATSGLAAAEPGTVPAAPNDPDAPAAVATGALLIGPAVAKDKADPLSLDPLAIARAQTTWLGLTPPGAAAAETTTALAVPGA
ncbi:MAG: hypothetical protein Q7T55_24185, partial [Solirubrobacteraceae bacterium]|nr:hypothetical protein [Solirubrobacteraceae bacterium]